MGYPILLREGEENADFIEELATDAWHISRF
jgi:hypothetical protein